VYGDFHDNDATSFIKIKTCILRAEWDASYLSWNDVDYESNVCGCD
jgi:hypothetical protein